MTARKLGLVLFILLLAVCAAAKAASEVESPAAAAGSDPLLSLRQEADQGAADARYRLGKKYWMGDGVPQDAAEAFRWYRMAAEQGHADAQFELGGFYSNSVEGVPRDYVEAMAWFRKAAAQGHTGSQWAIGSLYGSGQGVPKNGALAVAWTRLAAEQGDNTGMRILAVMYQEGDLVHRDMVENETWLRRAILHSDREKDKDARLKALDARRKPGLTPQMVEEAQERARGWRPKGREEVAADLAVLLETAELPHDRPDPRTVTAPPEQLVAGCIASIHARLKKILGEFAGLSGIDAAVVTETGLEYTNGTITWPNGEKGLPRYGSLDSCQLRISVSHPGDPPPREFWARRRSFPRVALTVDVLVLGAGGNADALREAVGSIVDEEVGWLAVYLQVARDRLATPAR